MRKEDAQFTQYMYNTIEVNPAYAGSRGVMSVFGLYRTQWVGLDGAPETSTFSINTPLNNSDLGLGVSLVNDKIGPTTENTLSADLSYTIPTSESWNLSFGIKGTANLFNIDINKLSMEDQNDEQFQNLKTGFHQMLELVFTITQIALTSDYRFQILSRPAVMMPMTPLFLKIKSIII